ncbi:5,10-methylenetetrahydromethanopterin reductase [Salarchaeum sp. JOR-1]|uniref:5,10-methylenetetrahydromethanopterin reductase n=1 Tax=Salarchaeum sp. JOR-1 TaxID=2599399 RepID=UPI001198931E|nr:5,10-methylenetetrahydromethanopterin reductase [Salarchaeum sp. JOR-1]QDX40023.1 5,10-methylenetetrahydromethanopterin reductase [Salarchaeum sp. JOR-1]
MKGVELTPEVPVREVASLAARAEDAGFDAVFASSHYNNRDPFQALALAADATESVRVGPGVANPYETHPVTLASKAATLDELSGGRAVFGVGAGDASTLRNLGVERDRPLRRVLEAFKVAQQLWRGARVEHDGTFVARDAGLNYEPGRIPVYVGAQGPHMLRMAAKHADGALVNASHPDDFAWARDRLDEGLDERPAERGEFESVAFASVSVAVDGEEARAAARPPVAFIAAGAAPPVLDRHGVSRDRAARVGEHIEAGEFDAAFDAVSETMLDAFCVAGTPDEVGTRLNEIREYVDGVVAGSPLGPSREAAIELLADA